MRENATELHVISYLIGVSISLGLLVLLRQARIPFFLYYPHTTDTVLISDSVDPYLFLAASLCVPGAILASRNDWKEKIPGDLVVISAVWAVAVILFAPINLSYAIPIAYVAVIMLALTLSAKQAEVGRRKTIAYIFVGAMTVLAMIECASIYYWVTSALSPRAFFGVASQDLETALTYSPYPIAPDLLLVVLFSWVWIPIVTATRRTSPNKPVSHANISTPSEMMNWKLFIVSLAVLAALSILEFYFLYAGGETWIVGVDSIWRYLTPLNNLSGKPVFQGVLESLRLYDGVYVGLLYLVESGTGISSFVIVKFAPLILAFSTSAFVLLAFRSAWSKGLTFLSAICALFWFPATLGIFGGIQDNWLAYGLWMLFLALYLNGSKRLGIVRFVGQSLLSVGILMLHPWTWGVFLATMIVAAFLSARSLTDLLHGVTGVFSAVWLAIPIGLAAFIYLPGVRGDIANAYLLYSIPLLHPHVILMFFGAWSEMWTKWSSFLPPILTILALVGGFGLAELDGDTKRYMLAWVLIWCVGSLLVAPFQYNPSKPAISETNLWRMLFLSPLPILLAVGVKKLVDLSRGLAIPLGAGRITWAQPTLISAVICAASLPLFLFTTPLVRVISLVSGTAAILLVTLPHRANGSARILIIIVLILILVNAAFRSLFPLLLAPYNA